MQSGSAQDALSPFSVVCKVFCIIYSSNSLFEEAQNLPSLHLKERNPESNYILYK